MGSLYSLETNWVKFTFPWVWRAKHFSIDPKLKYWSFFSTQSSFWAERSGSRKFAFQVNKVIPPVAACKTLQGLWSIKRGTKPSKMHCGCPLISFVAGCLIFFPRNIRNIPRVLKWYFIYHVHNFHHFFSFPSFSEIVGQGEVRIRYFTFHCSQH